MPAVLSPATNVVVFQWPWGTLKLAARGTARRASHLGRRPRLVDEDQPLCIEIELIFKPGFATLQDVRPALLRGLGRLFLCVSLCRRKNRHSGAIPAATPCSPRLAWISPRVMSGLALTSARIVGACASIRPDRRSPPSGPGRGSPCSRARRRHRLTLAALTPNLSPASRCEAPASTAANTRTRRFRDSAFDMSAGLRSGKQLESLLR
jgi:hypothetical protein